MTLSTLVSCSRETEEHLVRDTLERLPLEWHAQDLSADARRLAQLRAEMIGEQLGTAPDEWRHVGDDQNLHARSLPITMSQSIPSSVGLADARSPNRLASDRSE